MSKQSSKEAWKFREETGFPILITVKEMTYLMLHSPDFVKAVKVRNWEVAVQALYHVREFREKSEENKLRQ